MLKPVCFPFSMLTHRSDWIITLVIFTYVFTFRRICVFIMIIQGVPFVECVAQLSIKVHFKHKSVTVTTFGRSPSSFRPVNDHKL